VTDEVANALDPPTVRVRYRLTDGLDRITLDAAEHLLSAEERERSARLLFDHDRRDYIVAHALLRTMLSAYDGRRPTELAFETDGHGKPSLVSAGGRTSPLKFSLSHTTGLVACAVSVDGQVGVDCAGLDPVPDVDAIGKLCFSVGERSQLPAGDDERRVRFFELWTLKEAFAKAVGRGLALPLSAVQFNLSSTRGIGIAPPPEHAEGMWQCAVFWVGTRHLLALVGRDARDGRFSFASPNLDIGPDNGIAHMREPPHRLIRTSLPH
jgi:4'-phosphopantetheinyl transferase